MNPDQPATPAQGPDSWRAHLGLRLSQSELADFRAALDSAGFSGEGVADAIGRDALTGASGRKHGELLLRTCAGRPIDSLVRFFLIGAPITPEALDAALPRFGADRLLKCGLATQTSDAIRSRFELLPVDRLLVFFDRREDELGRETFADDYVMGVGSSTRTLIASRIRRKSQTAMDLGAGCGVLALAMAEDAETVVASDINPRAVAMTSLNAALNNIANIEPVLGSYFDPVKGRPLGAILTNPPFVISPERRYIYRDSGLPADDAVREICRDGAAALEEGGCMQVLCNWASTRDHPFDDRVRSWFKGTGCDAVVLVSTESTPHGYACTWISHTETDTPDQAGQRLDRWLAYYDSHGITAMVGGLITIRKRALGPPNFADVYRVPERVLTAGRMGDHILRMLDSGAALAAFKTDEALGPLRPAVAPDARIRHELGPGDSGWSLLHAEISASGSPLPPRQTDAFMSGLLMRCDGARTLGDLADDLASALASEHGADPAQARASALRLARRMIAEGVLLPGPPGAQKP